MAVRIKNILFVCTGNICRSPFAERLFTQSIAGKGLKGVAADSAGLFALAGRSATELAVRVAAEHGVNLSDHRARSVSKEKVDWSDVILVMEKSHEESIVAVFPEAAGKVLLLRHFARHGSRRRGVADPFGLNYEAYRFCFLDIEDGITGLVQYLSGRSISFEPIEVSCYAGYKGDESPRYFVWTDRKLKVSRIIDRWYESGADEKSQLLDYFKVEADDGQTYIIRYNRLFDSWAVMVR